MAAASGVSGAEEGGSTDAAPEPLVVPPAEPSEARPGSEAPGLDALLQLPSGYLEPRGRTVAGAGESEWRRRFEKAHGELDEARETLEATKRELDEVAEGGPSSQWAVAPPGAASSGGPSTSPLSYRLRQELARNREGVDEAERALRELRIEADLAGVPVEWRGDRNTPTQRRIPESPRYN